MIHYHGTPVGGSRVDVARFLAGRDALIPFIRPEDMPIAAEVCRSVVIDSGAFSVWTKGGTLDIDGYVTFCEQWLRHPSVLWAVIPDVIGGSEEDNDRLIDEWPKSLTGVPVWHYNESLERLSRLCTSFPIVALGSSGEWKTPGTPAWWERTADAMGAACDEQGRPKCKLHGLRMLSPKIIKRLPLSSADSTNCVRNANSLDRFGIYAPPTRSQRLEVIASRIEQHSSPAVFRFPRRQLRLLLENQSTGNAADVRTK